MLLALTGALYITMRHYRSKNPYFAFSLSPTLHIVITVTIRIISIFRIYANEIIHSTHATNHRTQFYSRQPKATQLNLCKTLVLESCNIHFHTQHNSTQIMLISSIKQFTQLNTTSFKCISESSAECGRT